MSILSVTAANTTSGLPGASARPPAAKRRGGLPMADQPASLNSYNQPAPLDAPAGALIAALRAAPEGDVLWTKEGDSWWIARNAPMDVLLRAGDLLRIPHVDHYSQITLADEVTRAARGP